MQGVSFTENVLCFVYVHVSDNSKVTTAVNTVPKLWLQFVGPECHHSFFTLLFIDEYIFDLKTCDVALHC